MIRRLRNTRESLDWEDVKAPIPTKFCKKVQRSGYSESYRTEVIKSGAVRERASARTEQEEAVPVEGTCALNRAPNSVDFHKK